MTCTFKCKSVIVSIIYFAIGSISAHAQVDNSLPPNPEAGKCYAKCIVDPEIAYANMQFEDVTFAIYTGSDPKVKTKTIKIILEPPKVKWIKKKSNKNCISANPDDCFFWDLKEEAPGLYETLKDAKRPKRVPPEHLDFKTYTIPIEGELYYGTISPWREVLCSNQVTETLIRNLQLSLINKGYDYLEPTGTIDQFTRGALTSFQKSNNFPVGALDIETLAALGVEY